jgi:hypothetical protein
MFGRRRSENLIDTAEMQGFFERLGRFNQEQLLSMRAAWQTTSREAHEDAWTTVRAVAATSGLSTEIERVRKKAPGLDDQELQHDPVSAQQRPDVAADQDGSR